MAGGEGTRLRPLTSNQPKPMVPIVGKPCMEHIIDLLRRHGIDEIVVTVAYLPQVIRGYFGDGESMGVTLHYSVEETPLGTAGSVKHAEALLDETFLVISGDALCDFDLTAIVAAHKAGGAVATLGLKSVENPLEFGVVIIDEDGRIERFLEKPSWGQVFSDTINTGVYVLEPEVLRNVPADEPYDFSKQLFPALLSRGKHLYGHVLEGYWQDVGNLEQYRQANFDALDGRIELDLPGIRLRDNVYLGDGVQLPELGQIQGPAFVGNYSKIEPGARIGAYSVLGQNAVVKDGAQIERSVIDSGSYIGQSARIEGAILGKGVDVRAHAVVNEGVAIGDECSIGSQSVLAPNVKVYPFKTIEAGAAIHSNLIWESRGITTLFGRDEVSGLVNVDITPDVASRIGMAYGTTLARDARIVVSRDANPAARMIKRSLISGLPRPASTSPTCGWRCRPWRGTSSRSTSGRAAFTSRSRRMTRRWSRSASSRHPASSSPTPPSSRSSAPTRGRSSGGSRRPRSAGSATRRGRPRSTCRTCSRSWTWPRSAHAGSGWC